MDKKIELINKIKSFNTKYYNDDQKNIAINILEQAPYEQVQQYYDFILSKKKFGFNFDASPEVAKGRIITLREDIDKRINVTEEVSSDENKLIIGNNYNALKSLLITHRNKIDIIYIDPPYNTESAKLDGNQSYKEESSKNKSSLKFSYKDKFGRNGWLNMMNDRLLMAKDLLSDDGVIFVSIDDSEQAYLKVLMDGIFGEENFINQLVWVSNKKGRQISKNAFCKTYEYILVYSKNEIEDFPDAKITWEWAEKNMPNLYSKKDLDIINDDIGEFIIQNKLYNTNISKFNIETRPNLYFPIFTNGKDISVEKIEKWNIILPPKNKDGIQGVWRWSKEKIKNESFNLYIEKKDNCFEIYTKIRERVYFPKDIILSGKMTTKSGGSELESLGISNFSYPKPTNLITYIISLFKKDSLILDFFAGTGTTGQAIMELNKQDGGNRQFILCTNNENNIADDITYERLYRIINGKGTREEDFSWVKNNKPYLGVKLRVLRVDDSIKISLKDDYSSKIVDDIKKGLYLLNKGYKKEGLNLYYDLSALNPQEKEEN